MGGFNRLLKHMREIQLGENDQSAALIQYSWNSSNFKKYDDCRFRVTATNDVTHKNRGVFVSIRRLNLRKSPEKNGECIDYIRLKFAEEKSPKFCGKLNASVDDVQKIYFGESGGMIEVHLHLDKFRPLKNIDDTLDIELVFTANQGKCLDLFKSSKNVFLKICFCFFQIVAPITIYDAMIIHAFQMHSKMMV